MGMSRKTHPADTTIQGTTFSGVAFAFATNNEAKEDIITEWPGAGSYTKQKVGHEALVLTPTKLPADTLTPRFPPCSITISTKKLSAGAPISPMPSPQQGTRNQEYKRWNGSSCS